MEKKPRHLSLNFTLRKFCWSSVWRLKWITIDLFINWISFFFLLLIGNYELYIEKEPTLMMSPSTLCKKFRFDGSQQNKTILECREAMLGDTIIVKKTDDGPLSLYELQPIGKCFSLIHPDDPAKDNFKKWKKKTFYNFYKVSGVLVSWL